MTDIVRPQLRVLHVSSSYPLSPGDATAPFMGEMLEALARRGHEVTALIPRVEGLDEGPRDGVRVAGVLYAPRPFQVWGYGKSLDARNRLRISAAVVTPLAIGAMALATRRLIRSTQPDVVHLHWVLPLGALGPFLPRSVPVVVSAHGADARFASGRLRRVARSALRRTDAVVAASSGILQAMASVEPGVTGKAQVIPHGANTTLFSPRNQSEARHKLGLEADIRAVVAVGRLVPEKGFDTLIAAFELTGADTHLYLVGDGPDRSRLEALTPPSLETRVHMLGAQDRAAVPLWFAAADIVAIPSRPAAGHLDSGPVVLMEALASGRAVVASPVGMVPDTVVSGKNGLIVDSPNPHDWATALESALADADALGHTARESFEEIGGWDRTAQSLEDVYLEAIRLRHPVR